MRPCVPGREERVAQQQAIILCVVGADVYEHLEAIEQSTQRVVAAILPRTLRRPTEILWLCEGPVRVVREAQPLPCSDAEQDLVGAADAIGTGPFRLIVASHCPCKGNCKHLLRVAICLCRPCLVSVPLSLATQSSEPSLCIESLANARRVGQAQPVVLGVAGLVVETISADA